MTFFTELKRRNVVRMAGLYLVGAWLLVQIAGTVLPMFGAPDWLPRSIVILLVIGFIPALIFSWAFELTPHGLKRDEDVRPEESIAPQTARRMNRMIIAVLVLALGYFAVDKFVLAPRRETAKSQTPPRPYEAQSVANAKSIAVLPFDNLSRDPDNAFFAEGVQDEILTRLAKVADLKVISRTSTQKYKSAPDNLREIAKQLGVMHVVEGSVQKSADQVRVNVQLINAMTDAHLWADTFDRKLTDIFAVESEIAHTIADILQARLSGSEKSAMSKKPTENSEAYELYLKGRFFWTKRTSLDLPKSAEFYNQAIAKDPNYALAYAGIADCYVLYPDYGVSDPAESYPQAREMALKALSLEPTLGSPHAALGLILTNWDRDYKKAIAEFDLAIQRDPNYATAYQWKNTALVAIGEFDSAIASSKKAIALDPLSLIVNADLAFNYIYARRFDDAVAQSRKTLEIDPNFHVVQGYLGWALQFKGQLPEALREFRAAANATDEPFSRGLLGQACARAGLRDEAQQILARLEEQARTKFVTGWVIAAIRLPLGDKDGAMAALEKAYEQHASEILPLKYDPLFDELHGDPRFEALVQKISSPPGSSRP
jgi:TolB-like protein/Tfp pilus assembly protein PilF